MLEQSRRGRWAIGATVAMAASAAVVAFDVSPVHAAQSCGGQDRVEVVPDGGTFECEATQQLPRNSRTTGESSNPQFTASASISSDGDTVSVTASGAPDGSTLHVASHRGISEDPDSGQAVFSGGTASVTVELRCGQVDVKATPPDVNGEQGVWRIAGPFITNTNDCAEQPATTVAPTVATTAPGPSTTTAVLAGAQSNTSPSGAAPSRALPATGGSIPSPGLLLALAAIAAGGVMVVAGRRPARNEKAG